MRARAAAALLLAFLLLGAAVAPAAAQCAMCKTALSGSPEGRVMSGHLNNAILMMIAAPYLVAGTVAGVLFRRQIATRIGQLRKRQR
jgi:hypothetical protein